MNPWLTIVIPTYNRPAALRRTLAAVLPQLQEGVTLVIVDNHSDTPVETSVRPLLEAHPRAGVRVIRNSVNIGGNANILRAFEIADTPWLWILGDDDRPLPDAIALIRAEIETAPDALFVNFATDLVSPPRNHMTEGMGLRGFIQALDHYGNALLISASIYRAEALREMVGYGYNAISSNSAHLAVLLHALLNDDRARARFSPKRIVDWGAPAEAKDALLYPLMATLRIVDMISDYELAGALSAKVAATCATGTSSYWFKVCFLAGHPQAPSSPLAFFYRLSHQRRLRTRDRQSLAWWFYGELALFSLRHPRFTAFLWQLRARIRETPYQPSRK